MSCFNGIKNEECLFHSIYTDGLGFDGCVCENENVSREEHLENCIFYNGNAKVECKYWKGENNEF